MRFLLSLAVFAFGLRTCHADILYGTAGSTYSQDFNSLAVNGAAIAWANDSTLPGWNLFAGSGAAIPTYNTGSGTSNAGSFYSFGTGTATERALGGAASGGAYFGSPAAGTVAGHIAVQVTNTTGQILDSVTIGFNGEQWRNGGNTSAQTMAIQYGIGSTFGSVSWTTPGGAFDYASPVTGATAAAVDGNTAGLVTGLGGTISNLTWNSGESFWIRWIENNDVGNDHGLAIDDFTFSAVTAVPEPTSLALVGLVGCAGLAIAIRRRKANSVVA